jgi:chromate transport protein ChrA
MLYNNYLNKIPLVEKILVGLFIIYIIMPIEMPSLISNIVDNEIGMILIFTIALSLFCYTSPIVYILYLFVAYELIRRSSKATGKVAIIKHTPSQMNKDLKMQKMNPIQKETLEEEMVDKMAPIGHSDLNVYSASTYSPVFENIGGASVI